MSKKYVAFLRGINLGKRNIKMDELCALFEAKGLINAKSVIASGNVLFDSASRPAPDELSAALNDHFGFEIGVIFRSITELQHLIDQDPFSKYEASSDTKFYLSLCANEIGAALGDVTSVPGDFDLVGINPREFFTVAFRQSTGRFGSGLDKIDRLFKGNLITTRNWNTVLKIVKKGQQ